jgi:hypothetical protein
VNIAMYDAVVGIHGRSQPYAFHGSAPADAMDQIAAAAAAHHVLETYSPYAQAALDAALATSKCQLDLTLHSTAVAGAERHFSTAGALNGAVIDARIWLGIHFRSADVDGVKMGQHTANWVLDHAFQPTGG